MNRRQQETVPNQRRHNRLAAAICFALASGSAAATQPDSLDALKKLSLEDLRRIALREGEPEQISGKQEFYEQLINMYI